MALKEIMDKLQEKLGADPAKMAGVTATYQFSLSGDGGGDCHVVFNDGEAKVNEGAAANADITISVDVADFKDLLEGKLDAMGAFMSGKLKIQGDMSLAMKLQSFLG